MYDLNRMKLAYLNNGFKDVTNAPSVKFKKTFSRWRQSHYGFWTC